MRVTEKSPESPRVMSHYILKKAPRQFSGEGEAFNKGMTRYSERKELSLDLYYTPDTY